jgi:DNA-dependent RNA polymerase auxiliary subunit epsilon
MITYFLIKLIQRTSNKFLSYEKEAHNQKWKLKHKK